jgi:hypothetical protein
MGFWEVWESGRSHLVWAFPSRSARFWLFPKRSPSSIYLKKPPASRARERGGHWYHSFPCSGCLAPPPSSVARRPGPAAGCGRDQPRRRRRVSSSAPASILWFSGQSGIQSSLLPCRRHLPPSKDIIHNRCPGSIVCSRFFRLCLLHFSFVEKDC